MSKFIIWYMYDFTWEWVWLRDQAQIVEEAQARTARAGVNVVEEALCCEAKDTLRVPDASAVRAGSTVQGHQGEDEADFGDVQTHEND